VCSSDLASALAYLRTLEYPGNIRQLRNLIERLTILQAGRIIEAEDIGQRVSGLGQAATTAGESRSLAEQLSLFEKGLIEKTLCDCGGNISLTARRLQVDRANLSRKIKELGLKIDEHI
jgi:two-component system nitrogen regulation response regulator NtrX